MEQKGNPDNAPSDNKEANNNVFGSSEDFFGKLEQEVNGSVDDSYIDDVQEPENELRNESPQAMDPQQATPEQQGNSNSIDWEKRYKDSSREAQKLSVNNKSFKKFEPLLKVMRNDEGLVNHIREYLQKGGKPPKSIKEELGLNKDFIYDQHEAVSNPDSDSAKVFDKTIERKVEQKVKKTSAKRGKVIAETQRKQALIQKAKKFQQDYKLPDEQFKAVLQNAAKKKLSFEDSYYLLNKDNSNKQVASNVRKDVMNQMQNARNIPQSASNSNSAQVEKNPNDTVFDSIMGSDDDVDNLFG